MPNLLSPLRDLTKNVGRLLALAWEDQKFLVLALGGLSILMAGIPFLRAGAIALLIDALVSARGSGSYRLTVAVALIIVAAVTSDLIYSVMNCVNRLFSISMEEKIELLFLRRKGEIDLAAYENPKFHDLLNRAEARGPYPMADLLQAQFSNLQGLIEVVSAAAILVASDWRVFLLILLGTAPKLAVEARYGRGIWGIFEAHAEVRRRFFDVRRHFYDLWSLAELKLFRNVQHFHQLLADLLGTFNNQQRRQERRKLAWQIVAITLAGLALGSAIGCFAAKALGGQITIGTLTFIFGSITAMQNALSAFFLSAARQYQFSLFATDLFRVIDSHPLLPQPAHPQPLDESRAPAIVFDDVSFAYPGSEKLVIRGVSLTIEPGQRLALIGLNGAGKTTLMKLLCRIYDPTAGRILVGNHDLREVDLSQWHTMLSIMFQDYATYHFLAKEVIALGRCDGSTDLSMEKVRRAARQSGADTFIEQWQNRYEQMLGRQFTGGIDPSKGQLQKLALARSFYRDARLMILDEPTSAIDAEGEMRIFEQFETLSRNTTLLLISHRFSTVRKADRVCVLDSGTIAELGSHDELMKLGGRYCHLFQLQAAGYRD